MPPPSGPDPRREAAEARAATFIEGLERLGAADYGGLSLPPDAAAQRAHARADALVAADVTGLGPLVDETREAARDLVLRSFAGAMYQPTWFGLNWGRSSGTAMDQAAIALAVEDAALAAVVRDVVDPATYDELAEAASLIVAMHPARAAEGQPQGRWARPIAFGLLATAILGLGAYATDTGWPVVAIPVVLGAAIIADLARSRRSGR